MTLFLEVANQARKLVQLNSRVERNAEQISNLSERVEELIKFTNKIAFLVKEQKRDISDSKKEIFAFQERNQSEREKFVLRVENELLKLESRLILRNPNLFKLAENEQDNSQSNEMRSDD